MFLDNLAKNRMEEDPQQYMFSTNILEKDFIKRQMKSLAAAAEKAGDIIQYETANNQEIQYALDIIANFLRKKGRVCYGGTAINAILPKNLQFYDPKKDLPDYDFFTPTPTEDIKEIVRELNQAGFTEVVERVGIHAGTHKIMVNFIPIADMTVLHNEFYKKVFKRSIVKEGIHYCDPDFLRMLMYLELSRPRGQVARWEKVFERLVLLNAAFPPKSCKIPTEKLVGKASIPYLIRNGILNYIIENERIMLGAEVVALYDWLILKRKSYDPTIQWFLKKNGMIVFMSPEANVDAMRLKELFNSDDVSIEVFKSKSDFLPERVLVSFRGAPLAFIVQESACHSFNILNLKEGTKLKVASLETMITLYISLMIFTEDAKRIEFQIECLSRRLVEMSEILHRKGGVGPIPAFSITCSGYQKGFATLLKEKFARIAREKKKLKTRNKNKNKTTRARTIKRLVA